jgi:hypothetical protein
VAEQEWTHWYEDDDGWAWRFCEIGDGEWHPQSKSERSGGFWRDDPTWPNPDDIKLDAEDCPENYPGFRIVREPNATPALPFTDADVDRLVEMQWAMVFGCEGWRIKDEKNRIEALEEYDADARAFLADYAAFKAKK